MRTRVWLSPCPGVGFRGVVLRRVWGFLKVLYRDLDGRCRVSWEPAWAWGTAVIPRDGKLEGRVNWNRLICWVTWHHPWVADGWESWWPIYCARCGKVMKEESRPVVAPPTDSQN